MCETGRCRLRLAPEEAEPRALRWDGGGPWLFWLEVVPEQGGKRYHVTGSLRRGGERMPLAEPVLLVAGGLLFWDDRVAPLDDGGAFGWVSLLRRQGPLDVPGRQKDELLAELLRLPRVPPLDLPQELRFEE